MNLILKYIQLLWLFLILSNTGQAQITVEATAGIVSGFYTTLQDACDNINTGYHQGDISIRVHASTTETASARIDSSGVSTGAYYTSITIMPADTATVTKVISTSASGFVLFDLEGADFITVDGRPQGIGSLRLLTFENTGATSTSLTMRLMDGASDNTFRYVNFVSNTQAVASGINVQLSTSAATTGNTNDSFYYCSFSNGRNNMVIAGTAANPMDQISITGCLFSNHGNVGININGGGVLNLVIDSNTISQSTGQSTASIGISLAQNVDGSVYTVTRNRIFDLRTTATAGVTGIQYLPSSVSPSTTPILNCFNNFIALTQPNTTASFVMGFLFDGTQAGVCRFIHNSVRIGGTHSGGSSGNLVSGGVFKTQSVSGSTWVCRNNIIINNRSGGTNGVFHTAGFVSGFSITGTYDIDYNIYWASGGAGNGPFPAIWNGTLYGSQADYQDAAAPYEQHSFYSNVTFSSNTELTLAGTSVNNFILMGVQAHPLVTNDILGNTRPNLTYKGAHQSNPFTNLKDAAVKEVYTLGRLPIPYAVPHTIRASIGNEGLDTLFNQQVDVTVSGTNSFTDSQQIDTLLPGESKYVSFNPFYYTNTGNCIVTISVPDDSTNTNNSKSFNQIVTNGVYGYAEPTLPSIGGVGFNGTGGDFIAKFPYSGYNNINQVGVNFSQGGQPYQIVIYGMSNDRPGALLWNSETYTSTTGTNTITVEPALAISGTFFVGVRQLGSTNIAFGYQSEDPVRDFTFYYKASVVNNWSDFASTSSAFRFMVEPRLQVADDIGVKNVYYPCKAAVLNSPPENLVLSVINYGLNQEDSFTVSYQITGPVNINGTDTFRFVGLYSSQEVKLNLSNIFNPNAVGSYTLKAWTRILGTQDLSPENDTLTYVFSVTNINNTNAGNNLVLNGTSQSATVLETGSLNLSTDMLTIEAWIKPGILGGQRFIVSKDNDPSYSAYALWLNASGHLVFRFYNVGGLDSIVSTTALPQATYSHIAATYDGNTIVTKLYINGQDAGTKLTLPGMSNNIAPLYIGRGKDGVGTYFSGSIDELKIWDTVRTDDQIRNDIHTRLPNFAHPNLKGYWRMDESSGPAIADASGHCNAGILENSPTFAASEIPLGTPAVFQQSINYPGGVVPFPGSNVEMNFYNQSGSNDVYIHKFAGNPIGVLPSIVPGGVASVHPNNWIVYRYGNGIMDSAEATFFTNGMTLSADPNDFYLFNRSTGSSSGWFLSDTANAIDPNTGMVTFTILPNTFNNQFSIGANNNPLPVQLLYLNAQRNHSDVQLKWATASETNNAGFAVERSTDGKLFMQIGFVKGAGDATTITNYSFTDANIFDNTTNNILYYRLVQTDFNGNTQYSSVVSASAKNEMSEGINLYPNPFTDKLFVLPSAPVGSSIKLEVSELTGRKLHSYEYIVSSKTPFEIPDLNSLPKGIYLIQTTINSTISVQKIAKF